MVFFIPKLIMVDTIILVSWFEYPRFLIGLCMTTFLPCYDNYQCCMCYQAHIVIKFPMTKNWPTFNNTCTICVKIFETYLVHLLKIFKQYLRCMPNFLIINIFLNYYWIFNDGITKKSIILTCNLTFEIAIGQLFVCFIVDGVGNSWN